MSETSLEDSIIEEAAADMAKSIDFDILAQTLESFGWTRVEMFYYAMGEVDKWLEENCKFEYSRHKDQFIFEDSQDANWFKLRWL